MGNVFLYFSMYKFSKFSKYKFRGGLKVVIQLQVTSNLKKNKASSPKSSRCNPRFDCSGHFLNTVTTFKKS